MPTSNSGKPLATLELPDGLVAETPALWIPGERTLSWRLRVDQPGQQLIGIRIGDQLFEKSLPGSRPLERRSPVRPGGSWLDQFVYPAESPCPPTASLTSLSVDFKPATVAMPGWTVREMAGVPAWMTVFFILSILFAFALRKRFGVTF